MKNNKKSWVKLGLLAVFSFLIALSSMANASDRESIRKLSVLKAYVESQSNATCRGRAWGEYSNQGDGYIVTTTLYSGNRYFIIGAGDSTVRDLDIALFDDNGNQVSSDSGSDAAPIVEVSPSWTGTFRIKVNMYSGRGYSNVMICYE